jgi:hypothetical protein
MAAARSRPPLGTVIEGAEVGVTKRAGSKDLDMGGLLLGIYTRGAAHGILAIERNSQLVGINKTVGLITQ